MYLYLAKLPRNRSFLILLILGTIGAAHLPLSEPLRTALTRVLLPPTLTYLILYVAFGPVLRAPEAVRYGDFSYGTYLYAFPIQQMLEVLLKGPVSFAAFVVFSFVASLAVGVASWQLVEKWFLPQHARLQRALPLRSACEEKSQDRGTMNVRRGFAAIDVASLDTRESLTVCRSR